VSAFVRGLAERFIALPKTVMQSGTEILNISEKFSAAGRLKWRMASTSIDSMSSDNPALPAMAALPFPPGV